jgi:carbonic anhydrase/acetyltransferase-like protein (isoleucine patch superfamily)
MLLKSGSHHPSIDPSAVIAPNATRIGARCVIGYGACLIAEGQPITLGEQVIVRDNAVIRSTAKYPVEVGNAVPIGPHTALFGCTIEDEVFLATGIRVFHLAVVRKGAEVRVNAVVHLKTVVPQGATVPIGWVAVGDPARILSPDQHDAMQQSTSYLLTGRKKG